MEGRKETFKFISLQERFASCYADIRKTGLTDFFEMVSRLISLPPLCEAGVSHHWQ